MQGRHINTVFLENLQWMYVVCVPFRIVASTARQVLITSSFVHFSDDGSVANKMNRNEVSFWKGILKPSNELAHRLMKSHNTPT